MNSRAEAEAQPESVKYCIKDAYKEAIWNSFRCKREQEMKYLARKYFCKEIVFVPLYVSKEAM